MTSTRSTFARGIACGALIAIGLAAGCGRHNELSRATGDAGGSASRPTAAPAKTNPATGDDACERLCAIAAKLHCPKDGSDCQSDCSQMREPPLCRHEMQAFIQCALGTSISDWHCDEEGESSVKEGVCEIEQREVARCVEQVASAS